MNEEEREQHLRASAERFRNRPPGDAEKITEILAEREERIGTSLVLPSGELVALGDTAACVRALDELRDLEYRIKELKAMLTDAIQDESRRQGTKTLTLNGGIQALVKGGEKVLWDAQALEAGLREAGMSEERIRQIVVEEVSYSVQAVEAKRAAAANPEYAAAVEAARTVVAARPTISVKRL